MCVVLLLSGCNYDDFCRLRNYVLSLYLAN